MTMKAIVWNGTPEPEVRDVSLPEVLGGRVRIRVEAAGICGTDLSILAGKHPRAQAPLVLGHEFVGTVDAVGDGVSGIEPGTFVTVEPTVSCGECVACRSGTPHVCSNLRLYGIDLPGGFAEYTSVAADRVVPIPASLPREIAVLAEPTAVAIHAVRRSSVRIGDAVVVVGGGPIGLLIALTLRAAGVDDVLISEPAAGRRGVADALGFDMIDPTTTDLAETAKERTDGAGADVVFEAAGSAAAILSATTVLRPRGEVVQVSIPKEPRAMSIVDITFKELSVVGVRVYEAGDFSRALRMLAAKPETFRPLLSDPYTLTAASEAVDEARSGTDTLRVVFGIA